MSRILMCAAAGALFISIQAVAQTPQQITPKTLAINGALIEAAVPSTNVPGPVPITYYLPKNYDTNRVERYPVLIQLHGGGASIQEMENSPILSVGEAMGGLITIAI